MKPISKRLIIVLVYFIIFLTIISFVYFSVRPESSCFDNIRNQNEESVDCGGICQKECPIAPEQNLQVLKTGFVESGIAGRTDLYAEIVNRNPALGSSRFDYEFKIKSMSGIVLDSQGGSSFILPGETKYVVETNVGSVAQPAVVELSITFAQWMKTNEFYEEPRLRIVNKKYEENAGGVNFSEASGLLRNESPLDFNEIKIKIILKNESGEIIALNSTKMNTVKAGENREFRASWPSRFSGLVSNMEIQPEVNVFDSEAHVKRFFKPKKFQE